ncbi:DUF3265 domain-containing protein [Vibrio parahaemolyticus]|nr:DUF3265 domain-containing protein [Vibrio parahaemolyticus]EIE1223009.1 DUF3265 domain-containing protein [Vibrio parahaemolyticus]EIE1261059.1 DUF3265 domain-containing protein [Vibrio parahaemolyticus]EIE1338840.1 DUF3265 domain-containing protein [Vibrio parahaemolyticus]EJC6883816.1 DUF3265 domain-containing protein [Vibrio parahaemolyticus]
MNSLGLQTNKLLKSFYYALILVIKVVCSGFGIALFTP